MSEFRPCPECGAPAEVCGTSYADRHYEYRRAPSPAVAALVETVRKTIILISPHSSTKCAFSCLPVDKLFEELKAALAVVEAEKEER